MNTQSKPRWIPIYEPTSPVTRKAGLNPSRPRSLTAVIYAVLGVLGLVLGSVAIAADLPVQDGLIVWLKADAVNPSDANQVRVSGSDIFVKQWNDQSGNNHPASNNNEGDQPLYVANALNNLPALRFAQNSGSEDDGDRLYLGDLGGYSANAATVFVVATIDNDGRYNLFGNRSGNDERWVASTWTESHPGSFRTVRADGFSYGSWPQTGSHIFALESDRTLYRVLMDGAEIGAAGPDYHSGSGANWTIGNRSTSGQQLQGDIAEMIIYNHTLTSEEANQVGMYLADKYGISSAYTPATITPQAIIYDFSLPGNPGIISGNDISIIVPFRTDVTALAPTYILSAGATCDKASGSAQNFSTPQTYTIVSSDQATTNVYTVTVNVRPPTVTYDFNSGLQGWTQLWPTNPLVLWQGGVLGSGYDNDDPWTRFARSPEFILHGLEDLTVQLAGGQSPLDTPTLPSAVPQYAINGGGFAGVALRDVAADTYVLWKRRTGNGGGYQTERFTTAELSPYAIPGKKYTLDYMDYNSGSWGWTYLDNVSIPGYGTRVTLDAGDPVLSLGVPSGTLTAALRIPEGFNQTTTVTVYVTNGNPGAVTINGSSATTIAVTFAAGGAFSQNLTIAPVGIGTAQLTGATTGLDSAVLTVTVCPPLIGRWLAGTTNLIESSGYRSAGTHDGVAVGTASALAFTSEVPPGCSGQSLDLRSGNVGVMITNSATTDGGYLNTYDDIIRNKFTVAFWAKGFPGTWNGWVSKRGEDGIGWQLRRFSGNNYACFTVRGLDSEDGDGGTINVNDNNWHHYAGAWDQATGTRKLYVDGVYSHTVNNTVGQMMNQAAAKHLAFGARQQGGTSAAFESYFAGLLYDVRIYSYPLSQSEVRALIPPAIQLTSRSAVRVGASTTLTVTIPLGANASAPVTVYLTNSQPSLLNLNGNTATVVPVAFAVGNPISQAITINGLSAGQVQLSAGAAGMASASTAFQVYVGGTPGLIGQWVAGAAHLADVSGYTDGTHDGSFIGVPPAGNFTSETPLGQPGQSLDLRAVGNIAVRIDNSRNSDAGYQPTFDDDINTKFSVAFWAKGFPDTWNGWVSKYGESGKGWQLRRSGGNPFACFTVRGQPEEDGTGSSVNVNDSNWHHYIGVWDGENGNRYLYVDGVISHTNAGGFAPMGQAPGAHLALGARGDESDNYSAWFKGLLYDVRMYNSALTAEDALDLVGAILTTPSSMSLFSPSPNTNWVTITVPPSLVAAADVNIVITSDKPGVAIPEGAVAGVRIITLPKGGANTTAFAVQANGAGTARFTYSCTLLPAMSTTTVAVQQPNIGGLVAYWNFDNQTLAETSGFQAAGAHDGVAVGNVAYVPGRLGGYAADLRAANTAVRVKNSTASDPDYRTTFDAFMFGSPAGFTWSAWVKGLPASDWASWIAKDGETAGFAVRKAGGSQVTFTLRNSDGPDDPTDANAVITDNLWHHLAAVYDPVALQRRLYVDGVERLNIVDSNLTASATGMPLYFGARDASGDPRFARVIVDEIRAYDKTLTLPEITAEVGAPMITLTPNVVNQNLDDPDVIATITVPTTLVATSAVTVTLTSANPAVATLVGATAGSLTVNFARGGANTASVAVHATGVGTTVISGTSSSGMVNGEIAVTISAAPVLLGQWVSGAEDLVERSGYRPAGTHDGVAVGNNAGALAYSTDLPPNFTTGKSLDLTAGEVAVQVANSSTRDGIGYQPTFDSDIATKFTVAFWARGMPGEWAGWVTKYGEGGKGWQLRRMGTDNIAGFTLRGVDNDDGWGSGINVNDGNWHHFVGIWDQASGTRQLYVDGVYSHTVYNNTSQSLSQALGAHLVFGGRQDESGNNSAWVSCLLFDVRIYSAAVSEYKIGSMLKELVILPSLTVQSWTGNQVRISWPESFSGYDIEQSSDLIGGWGPSGLAVSVEGNENVAYAPTSTSPQFFRLKK